MAGAYNAGPARWEAHLTGSRSLPNETVGYLAKLGPTLGFGTVGSVNSASPPNMAPSFESALIFALGSTQVASRPGADRQRILTIIDTNSTIVPQLAGLFVRSSKAEESTTNDQQIRAPSPIPADTNNGEKASATIFMRRVKPLFAPRSHDRNKP